MQWVWLSLIGSFVNACVIHTNHHFKVDGLVISVYKNLYAFLFVLLVAPFVDWSLLDATFYIAWAVVGFLSVFVDVGIFNAAAKHGSRLTSLYMPIRILVGFFVWFIFDPDYLQILLDQPLVFGGVLGCLLLSCVAIFMLRANDASWLAFRSVAPVGVVFVVIDVLVKSVMPVEGLLNAAMASVVVLFSTTFVFASIFMYWRDRVILPKIPAKAHKACLMLAGLFCLMIPCFNSAQATTPNPAYMSAVMLTSVVWLMILHKFLGIKDDGNPFAGLAFVLSAVGIVLLTS